MTFEEEDADYEEHIIDEGAIDDEMGTFDGLPLHNN
jgi:hypothetical protein